MYNRDLTNEIISLSKQFPVISITGPRQSGKTTLCKIAFPGYKYVNLEHIPTLDMIQQNIDGFLDKHKNGLIIDEAQNFPEIFSYIQAKVDDDKSSHYVLSGSSDFLLMENIAQSLAGRVAVKRLLPLSLNELGDTSAYTTDELMQRGFYPAVWGDGREAKYVYESYYETYIERDVRRITNVQNLADFRKFVTLAAGRIGTEFNASSLGNEIGVSSQTVNNWMSILETSYTAFRVQPYFKNIGKRLTKTPKIFFYDVGLVCWLLGIRNAQDLETHPLRGSIFENMIMVEFLKKKFHNGEPINIYYYRDKSQREVDVIIEKGAAISAYEVKSAQSYHPDFHNNLKYLKDLMKDSVSVTKVIYNGDYEIDDNNMGLVNFRHI